MPVDQLLAWIILGVCVALAIKPLLRMIVGTAGCLGKALVLIAKIIGIVLILGYLAYLYNTMPK